MEPVDEAQTKAEAASWHDLKARLRSAPALKAEVIRVLSRS